MGKELACLHYCYGRVRSLLSSGQPLWLLDRGFVLLVTLWLQVRGAFRFSHLTSMPLCQITPRLFLVLLYPSAVLDQHTVRLVSTARLA